MPSTPRMRQCLTPEFVAVFIDGPLADEFVRVKGIPTVLTVVPKGPTDYEEWMKSTPKFRTAATYFLVEADTLGVGTYSTTPTAKD